MGKDTQLTAESINDYIRFMYKVIKVLGVYIRKEGNTDFSYIAISEMMLVHDGEDLDVRYTYSDDCNNIVVCEEYVPVRYLDMKCSEIRQDLTK